MFKVIAILALTIASASAFWNACTSGPGPTSVSSPSCSGTSCSVTRGEPLSAVIVFPANVATSTLDVTITAYSALGGDGINIPPSEPNACVSLSPSCPTSVGTSYTWTIDVPIPTGLPAINGYFAFTLSSGGTIVSCANATATLL